MIKSLRTSIILFVLLSFISCNQKHEKAYHKMALQENWFFWQEEKNDVKLPAVVPGCVHLDLIYNKAIPDPFRFDNEQNVSWIENKNWVYETHFSISDSLLQKDFINLVFEGLDTYSHVFLNEKEILSSENMFLKYQINVKAFLKKENTLKIVFASAIKNAEPLYDQQRIQLPADNDRNEKATSVFTRKAPYQYGWDWGPRLVGVGIWKDVFLEFWNDLEIEESRIFQKDLKNNNAEIGIDIQVEAAENQNGKVEVYMDSALMFSQEISINKGQNQINQSFILPNPKLWWPNGSGDAYLYHFKLKCTSENSTWEKEFQLGFRTIELERKPDSIGESFTFLVNGIPIYIKGANYIPQDAFPSRVQIEDYQQTLQMAKEANMNMLRVWGGGIYENDEFYELCDEMGILVWQDFMFACSLYPGDSAFIKNVKEEAIFQIKRLRDHPSLALWCGNNEMNELWNNWGYQKKYGYSTADSAEVWQDYLSLFDELLPRLVKQLDAKTFYLESTPVIGWGHEESMNRGDSHYWGIWWGKQPFEKYEEKIPRFSSEFGFQSLPHLNTILSFTRESQLNLFSDDMKAHQKSSIGNQTILDYLPLYYPQPNDFKELIYVSQLLQAYGMDLAFKAQRMVKPRCMGTLFWQLNDCWPGLSWSSLDYYKQKKATHYMAEKDFATFLVQSEIKDKKMIIKIVSDSLQNISGNIETAIISFSGDTIKILNNEVMIPANQVNEIQMGSINPWQFNPAKAFIYTKLSIEKRILAENIDFFGKPKDLQFPKADLMIEEIGENEFLVSSTPSVFNYSVYLSTSEFGNFEPNFFHLLPSEKKVVNFVPNDTEKIISKNDIEMISLNAVK